MSELFVELFSEEIPAKLQINARNELKKNIKNFFIDNQIKFNEDLIITFPEENDFLFFVARGDGYHTFSTNKRDHDKAKRKFQKIRRKIKRESRKK